MNPCLWFQAGCCIVFGPSSNALDMTENIGTVTLQFDQKVLKTRKYIYDSLSHISDICCSGFRWIKVFGSFLQGFQQCEHLINRTEAQAKRPVWHWFCFCFRRWYCLFFLSFSKNGWVMHNNKVMITYQSTHLKDLILWGTSGGRRLMIKHLSQLSQI